MRNSSSRIEGPGRSDPLPVVQPSRFRLTPITPHAGTHEHTRSFRRLVKCRTGCEGPISYLASRPGVTLTTTLYHPPMTRVQHHEPSWTPLTAMGFFRVKWRGA